MPSAEDLNGAWRLVDHFYLGDDGKASPGPLGKRAEGLLIYHSDGFMAASLMRADDPTADQPAEADSAPVTYLGSVERFLSYSGRWQVDGDLVVHEVAVGSHPRVVNTRQRREARLTDGVLTLRNRVAGEDRYVVMEWRRA